MRTDWFEASILLEAIGGGFVTQFIHKAIEYRKGLGLDRVWLRFNDVTVPVTVESTVDSVYESISRERAQ